MTRNWYKIEPGKEGKEFKAGVKAFAENEGFDSLESVEARMGFLTAFARYSVVSEHTKSPFLDPFIRRRMNDILYSGPFDMYQYFDGYYDLKND